MAGALPAVPLEALTSDDPREIGDFRLLGRLGTGGMGIAYLADGPTGWAVVKTMWPQLRSDPAFRARLGRELDAMRATASPQVAAVLAQDLLAESPWFAMEFVPGLTLKRRVEENGPLPARELRDLASGLASALAVTNAAGVVHRDLKPANIMMSPTGPRLIDFGVADMAEATQLTATGFVVGSAGWLAPEQITGNDVTTQTDVHAWGLCVLYAATGKAPFAGENTTATIYQVLHTAPEVPASLGNPLAPLVTAALAKDPAARPSVTQLVSQSTGAPLAAAGAATTVQHFASTAVTASPAAPTAPPPTPGHNRGPALLIGALVAIGVLALAGIGIAVGRGTANSSQSSTAASSAAAPTSATPTTSKTAQPAPLATPTSAKPTPTTAKPTTAAAAAPVASVIPSSAFTNATASPGCSNSFGLTGAELLIDADGTTGWRCDNRVSNAEGNTNTSPTAGQSVDFYLNAPYAITQTQMIEGAATDSFRWCENGRLQTVQWDFNDGTAPVTENIPDRSDYPGASFVTTDLPDSHTTDHVTMSVVGIYPAGTVCTNNGETGRPWEYGPTAKPSEVRFVGYRA